MPPWSLSVTGPSARSVRGPSLRADGVGLTGPVGQACLPGQVGVELLLRAAAKGADGLGPDPERRRGEVGERDLFQLDDLYRAGVRARRDRALARLVARLVEDSPPPSFPDVEDPVHL